MEDFVERHYRKIIGKVFAFEDTEGHHVLLYAERKTQDDGNGKSYTYDAESDPHIEDGNLVVSNRRKTAFYRVEPIALAKDVYKDTNKPQSEYAVVGYYKDQSHLEWICEHGIYNMRAVMRGKRILLSEAKMNAKLLILHNEQLGQHVFKIVGDSIYKMKRADLPRGNYTPSSSSEYYIYDIAPEAETDHLLDLLISSNRFKTKLKDKKPVTILIDKLREMSKVISFDEFVYKIEEEETFISLVAEDEVRYASMP